MRHRLYERHAKLWFRPNGVSASFGGLPTTPAEELGDYFRGDYFTPSYFTPAYFP